MFKKDVINEYNKLLKKQQALLDKISNLGREKDYNVQKIEKKYDSMIDEVIREEQSVALLVNSTREYINVVDCGNKVDLISKTIGFNSEYN